RADDLVQAAYVTPRAILGDELRDRSAVTEIADRKVGRDRRGEHPQAVSRRPEVPDVEGEHEQSDDRIDDDDEVAGEDVARHPRELVLVGSPDGLLCRRHHFAPFPERITFTVSSTIVRSNTTDRCLM